MSETTDATIDVITEEIWCHIADRPRAEMIAKDVATRLQSTELDFDAGVRVERNRWEQAVAAWEGEYTMQAIRADVINTP